MKENIYYSIACIAGAGIAYYYRVQKHKKALAQASFPTVLGKINSSTVVEKEHTTSNEDGSTDTSVSYVPRVTYDYQVNGVDYQNNRIEVLDEETFSRKELADAFISAYPEGQKVPVFYDPSEPKVSFLNNQVSSKKIDFNTWLLILLLVGVAIYLLFA